MSVSGVKFRAYPTANQREVLGQWMGCVRFVWNAKCDEQEYFYQFKRKFCSITTIVPVDQTYAQFKNPEMSPWLFSCPSVLLRNTMCTFRETFLKFLKGECGKPNKKRKGQDESLWFTSEIFRFDGKRLFLGGKKFDMGELPFKAHRSFKAPHSLRVRREAGKYYVSFCYDDTLKTAATSIDTLKHLQTSTQHQLERIVVGIDRGVKVAAHTGTQYYHPPEIQDKRKQTLQRQIQRLQKRLSRQVKGSFRREHNKSRIQRKHKRIANMHRDFAHQTSHHLIKSDASIFAFEDLATKRMTKRPRIKKNEKGRFLPNQASAKAGLNRAILDKTWSMLLAFCEYKAAKNLKAVFKISAHFTSQECAGCGHIHPDNRESQAVFHCTQCGHSDNADANAAKVIKNRAIKLILDPGTGLSDRGVLLADRYRTLSLRKTGRAKTRPAISPDVSKKRNEAVLVPD